MPKAKGVYILAAEPQSGKSVVLLGLMELLSRHVGKMGFFRPLVREGETKDDALRLISALYHLPFPGSVRWGMNYEKARTLVSEENYDEVLKRIIQEYGSLESECDIVVSLGTGFHDIPPGLSFDFNIDVANNLGAMVAPVITGSGRTAQEVVRRSFVLLDLLETRRCEVLALFVNRVAPERVDEISGLVAKGKAGVPIFVLPELASLAKPTVGELRRHKGISEQMAFDMVADVAYFGTLMVHCGHADGLVSGAVHTTAHTLRPAFEIIGVKPGSSLASSVFFMCLPDRVLVFGDCAVNPEPTVDQLADITVSSAETARAFGIEPRVAMLSYSTGDSGKGADVEKVREATRRVRLLRQDLPVEGPIQYDAAVDPAVAKVKLPGSQVAGRATVFIFPDLNNGNITYKAVQRSSGAAAIGPVIQGLKKPVNDLSRGATVTDIVDTVVITAIQAQERGAGS